MGYSQKGNRFLHPNSQSGGYSAYAFYINFQNIEQCKDILKNLENFQKPIGEKIRYLDELLKENEEFLDEYFED